MAKLGKTNSTTEVTTTKLKKGGGLSAKVQPNAALAEIVGKSPLPRTEITKRLWVYIKQHGLNTGKTINPDATLAGITGKASFDMMQLARFVSANLE